MFSVLFSNHSFHDSTYVFRYFLTNLLFSTTMTEEHFERMDMNNMRLFIFSIIYNG